jgi:hypothetical protein
MTEIKLSANETRKNYLVRAAIAILNENAYDMKTIIYDEAECDAFCLAEDLRCEFDIEEN